MDAFYKEYSALYRQVSAARYAIADAVEDVETMQKMLAATAAAPGDLDARLHDLRQQLYDIDQALTGDKSRGAIGDYDVHNVNSWLGHAYNGVDNSSYGPTPSHRRSLEYAAEVFAPIREQLNQILDSELPALREDLENAGAPWGRGQVIPAG